MRVTAATRAATRGRILAEAGLLFASDGFTEVTTRRIAAAAGIAAGTLFNYFPSKEVLASELLDQALSNALAGYAPRARGDESLPEDLFSLVLAAMHAFTPLRATVGPVLAVALGPYTLDDPDGAPARLRLRVMEAVQQTVTAHRVPMADDPVTAHLFWTLFLGVLAFWSTDSSPDGEDTLVLLDQSMRLFAGSLPAAPGAMEASDAQ